MQPILLTFCSCCGYRGNQNNFLGMKIFYKSTFSSLFALLVVLASCSPEYGAHFAPSKQSPQVAVQENNKTVAPLVAQETAEVPMAVIQRAEEAGATEVVTDIAGPVAAPAVEINTAKQQRQVIRQLRKKLKGMSNEERQLFKEQVQRQLQEQQLTTKMADDFQREGGAGNISPVLLAIVTIFIPPLGVFLHQGAINTKFWISLVLTLLFYVPGLIYSLLVVFNVI